MSPRTRLFTPGRRRSSALLCLPILFALGLVAAACTPPVEEPPGSTTTTTTTVVEPTDPIVTGQACQPDAGVTVVVDFTALDNSVRIGCAPGEQADGLAALAATGFTVGSESGAGTVCTIDGLPTEGYPFCWLTGGYWSYWKSPNRATAWDFSQIGVGDGPIAEGSVEGWSWAPAFDGAAPRVSVADLAQHTPEPPLPVCAAPDAPVLSIIASNETLPFTVPALPGEQPGPIEIAVIAADADPATAVYTEASTLALSPYEGRTIRVLARSAAEDCTVADTFDATYDVRATYPGRLSLDPSSPAIPTASTSIVGWATGHSDYTPGTDVAANWQVPANGYGSAASGLLPLGNGGSVTMTFASPITDGAGADLAVWENGFFRNATSEDVFAEYGWVEVSSNGTDFVRFDSASQWQTPIGAFGYIDSRRVGGLAGRDGAGFGTPFDLSTLRNKAAVRSGTVDLSAITHVRVVDVVGGSAWPNAGDDHVDLDAFGRTIVDNFRTVGSGGFDLAGIAVLHSAS